MARQTVTMGVNFSLNLSLSFFRSWKCCLFPSITTFFGFELLITAPFKVCKPGRLTLLLCFLINEWTLEPLTTELVKVLYYFDTYLENLLKLFSSRPLGSESPLSNPLAVSLSLTP